MISLMALLSISNSCHGPITITSVFMLTTAKIHILTGTLKVFLTKKSVLMFVARFAGVSLKQAG